jgi:hypothetical protein
LVLILVEEEEDKDKEELANPFLEVLAFFKLLKYVKIFKHTEKNPN